MWYRLGIVTTLLLCLAWTPGAHAQGGPNAQLLCFNLFPVPNTGLSPGLNRGHPEGFWILCRGVIDGQARDVADGALGGANDGLYRSMFLLPTLSQKQNENGISDVAAGETATTDEYGADDVLPIPAGHPAAGAALGAEGDFGMNSCAVDVRVDQVDFHEGASLFAGAPGGNKSVIGVTVPVDIDCGPVTDNERIDLSFAIRLAPDDLKKIGGGLANGPQQGFPGTEAGVISGAAGYFSGPGPLFVGYFVGDPTGIATVPIRVLEAEGRDEFASISGKKFCDTDLDGSCSDEHLVDGVTIKVTLDTFLGPGQMFFLVTPSSKMLERVGNNIVETTLSDPGTGEYELFINCNVLPNGSTTVKVEEVPAPPAGFTDQTAPPPPGFYEFTLSCNEDRGDLDFGNVKLVPSDGDPHTIGFWGSLVKKALNTIPADCNGTQVPGSDVLPFSGFPAANTPALVADLIEAAVAGCNEFSSLVGANDTETLCNAAFFLPPGNDEPIGNVNAQAQLLALLLNIEADFISAATLVDKTCLGFSNGLVPVGEIAAAACADGPALFQALLDAINNQTPGVAPFCLLNATCPPLVLAALKCPLAP